jgi:hypothetical protein
MAVVSITLALVWCFFLERRISFDDLIEINPPYMFVNYGVLSWPSHGDYYHLALRPPSHSLMVGLLMKALVPVPYAEALPTFILISIAILLVVRSSFSDDVKISLMFGLIAGSLLPAIAASGPYGAGIMRPDYEWAFAWFAGLVGLESGRLNDWNPTRVFVGSLLLTYSSTTHYPAILGWTGVVVYFIWIAKTRGWKIGRRPMLSLAVGVLLVEVPFLLLWAIPNFLYILGFLTGPGGENFQGIAANLSFHSQRYLSFATIFPYYPSRALFFPLLIGVPCMLFSVPILFSRSETRGLAVASLPNLLLLWLFIKAGVGRSGFGEIGLAYYFSEFMLYCTVAHSVRKMASHHQSAHRHKIE